MKSKIWVIIFLASLLLPMSAWAAPSATLTAGTGSGNPGNIGVIVPISLASVEGAQVSAFEFELLFDDALLDVSSVTLGGATSGLGKEVQSSIPATGTLQVLLFGGQTAIGDGVVVNIGFDIDASAPAGSIPLTFANVVLSSPQATEVAATPVSGSLDVTGSAVTFGDVPRSHWAWKYVEALYQEGYVSGCSSDPLLFCPENELTRGEMAVFIVRGEHGADFTPPQPTEATFGDVVLSEWHAKWDTQLFTDGYTAGCSTDPLNFCPLQTHLRKESPVYFERMLHGVDYYPEDPTSSFYTDVPFGEDSVWYSKWVWAAHVDQIIQECEDDANRGDAFYRPEDGTTRAEAACIMAKSKALALPE